MARISEELMRKLENGYRLVDTDENGWPIRYVGEVIMFIDGVWVAYTGNVDQSKEPEQAPLTVKPKARPNTPTQQASIPAQSIGSTSGEMTKVAKSYVKRAK